MPLLSTLMGSAVSIDADTNNDFIWSPNETETSDTTYADWTNGYFMQGLPSDNADSVTIVK